MKKLFLLLILGMFLISFTSALDFDNLKKDVDYEYNINPVVIGEKTLEYNDIWEKYKPIEIKNAFGLGEVLFKGAITKHTDSCSSDCESVIELEKTNDGVLIEDIRFVGGNVNSYNIQIKTGEELVLVDDYELQCVDLKSIYNPENDTYYTPQSCSNVKVGSHFETEKIWSDYNIGEEVLAGNYEVKISGDKSYKSEVDWQIQTEGKWLEEWAIWNSLNELLKNKSEIAYQFNEEFGTVILDSKGYSNGTTITATYNDSVSISGKSMQFDAQGESIKINTTDLINSNFTLGSVSLWAYPYNISEDTQYIFSSEREGSDAYINLMMNFLGGNLTVTFENDSLHDTILTSKTQLIENDWNHIVITWNSSKTALYLNNVLLNESSGLTNPSLHPDSTTWIGSQATGGGASTNRFRGLVDEFIIFNSSLNSEEIDLLYLITTVNLNSPIDNFETLSREINFSCSGDVIGESNLTNISLWIDGSLDQTNIVTGTTNTTNFTKTFSTDGSYDWTCQGCDSDGNCGFASENRTISITNIIFNNVTYDNSTYETSQETFSINISSSITNVLAKLVYNGTEYTTTKTTSGDNYIFTKTLDIETVTGVTNKSFYWNIYNSTVSYDSVENNQTINPIYFTLCNATINDNFLNISFKDEADMSNINASIPNSIFEYYLGDGSITKTYNFVNNTDNFEYNFCATPTDRIFYVDSYVQYKQNSDYPQRLWNPSVTAYNNTQTDKILYLLSSVDGIYVTFQVINTAEQTISDVVIEGTREISGEDITVATGTTDTAGTATFWLNPDYLHTFYFTKDGFGTTTTSLTPSQTSYTITLGTAEPEEPSTSRGISYSVTPVNSSLLNDTTYTFGFELTSSYWDVDEYGFNLRYNNGTLITGSSTSVEGTLITKNLNTIDSDRIYMDYYWLINSTYTNATRYWNVYNSRDTQWSISQLVQDFNLYLDSGIFGLTDFGRFLIVFMIILLSVGIISFKYGLNSPLMTAAITFTVILTLYLLGVIPETNNINNILVFVSGAILLILGFREVRV